MVYGSNKPTAWLAAFAGVVLALGLPACHDHEGDDHGDHPHNHDDPVGPPSGAECPDDSTLTYGNFGKMFMEDYCTRCHSSTLEPDARNDAPDGHDFDTIEGIWAVQDHIDQVAAAGPDNTNQKMPIGDPKPSVEMRRMLGEWLACGAPED